MLEVANELLEKLPSAITPFPLSATTAVRRTPAASGPTANNYSNVSPFWVLLSNEVMELNDRLSMLKISLNELIKGVKSGFIPELHVYKALAENTVPHLWKVRELKTRALKKLAMQMCRIVQ